MVAMIHNNFKIGHRHLDFAFDGVCVNTSLVNHELSLTVARIIDRKTGQENNNKIVIKTRM